MTEPDPYVVIVTGARDFPRLEVVDYVLNVTLGGLSLRGTPRRQMMLHVGDCPTGVDARALAWAKRNPVSYRVFYADWETFKRQAGPRRNSNMVNAGGELGLAFWDGKIPHSGTLDCLRKIVLAGIQVNVFGPDYGQGFFEGNGTEP